MVSYAFAADQLKSIVERIERLEVDKKAIEEDIKDIYAESKGNGYDVKALKTIIRMRKQDPNEREEAETVLETYMQALGMLPLFAHAEAQPQSQEVTPYDLGVQDAIDGKSPTPPAKGKKAYVKGYQDETDRRMAGRADVIAAGDGDEFFDSASTKH